MNNTIPGTVSCLLCRGAILFRDGDRSRFYAHMNNEHGAFFDLDYLLASSLMDQTQKEVVIRNVFQTESHDTQETLGEAAEDGGHSLKRERTEDDAEMDSEYMGKRINMGGDTAVVQPTNNDDLRYLHSGVETNMNQSYDEQEQLYYSVTEEPQVADTNLQAEETAAAVRIQDNKEEKTAQIKTEKGGGERFECQVEGCGRSYTNKSNRITHERKAHGLLGKRSKVKNIKKEEVSNDPPLDQDQMSAAEPVLEEAAESLESMQEEPRQEDITDNVDPMSSFLTDTSLGFESSENMETSTMEIPAEETVNHEQSRPETVAKIDLSSSKYFERNPKCIAIARGKSLALFEDTPDGLPEGWRMRNVEVTTKTGEKSTIRHYLSPEQRVLKTGLGVIEFLRVTASVDQETLEDMARKLNIPDKKFKSLFV